MDTKAASGTTMFRVLNKMIRMGAKVNASGHFCSVIVKVDCS
jgi:hypothetical protein